MVPAGVAPLVRVRLVVHVVVGLLVEGGGNHVAPATVDTLVEGLSDQGEGDSGIGGEIDLKDLGRPLLYGALLLKNASPLVCGRCRRLMFTRLRLYRLLLLDIVLLVSLSRTGWRGKGWWGVRTRRSIADILGEHLQLVVVVETSAADVPSLAFKVDIILREDGAVVLVRDLMGRKFCGLLGDGTPPGDVVAWLEQPC